MKTIQIKPSHVSQGEFVIINEADFDESIHRLYDPAGDAARAREVEAAARAAAAVEDERKRLEKVAKQKAEDEAAEAQRLRDKALNADAQQSTLKPSDGLTVEQLQAALVEKGIAVPNGLKKAELQALLDAGK